VRSAFVGALAAALVTSSLLMSGPLARGSPEVLLDEGFEDGVGAWIAGGGVLSATSAFAHEGVQSAMFSADADGLIQSLPIPIQPERNYTLTAFFLKDDPRIQSIALRLRWEDENRMSIRWSPSVTLTGDEATWRYLAVSAPSPREGAFATVQISVSAAEGGLFYFDDVEIEGPPPLPATATPAPTEAPPAEPSPTATPAPSGTATPSRVPSATPSATPTAGPGSSLVNGGFEDADDGAPSGWLKYGGKLSQTAEHYRSGGHSGAFRSDTESTKWTYQALTVSGGSAYEFDTYVLLDDPGAREAFLRISWYESDDAGGSAIAVSDSPARLSGNDSSFRYLTTGAALAPQSARTARFRVMLVPASSATTTVYLDDASVRQVAPELAATPAPPPAAQDDLEEVAGTIDKPAGSQRPLAVTAARSLPRQGESPYAVKVNEVEYDPVQPGDEAAFEWLELYNAGSEPVDLAGWTLSDNSESDVLPSLVLGARSYAVVAASEAFRDGHPAVSSPVVVVEDGRIGSGLANKGDHVLLYDPSGRLADGVSWGDDEGVLSPSVPAVAPGHSIERSSPGRDTDTAADFVDNGNPSPGRGIGEAAVAGAAIERQAVGSSAMSPPERAALGGSSDVRQRLIASLAAGFVALAAGFSAGAYWRRRLSPWP
jgi:hypothetical protein